MRDAAALTVVGAVPALIGGLLYDAATTGASASGSVALAFWIAAAVCLAAMAISRLQLLWRWARRPLPEGWVFVAAAIALTAIGAVADAV